MLPTIFLPGTLCDERVFHHLLPHFQRSEVVNLRLDDSVDAMVERVAKVGFEHFNLIGFSMGGRVGQEFSLKYPSRVNKFIAIASSSDGYPPHEKEIVKASLPMIHMGKFKGISDRRLKEYLSPEAYKDQALKDLIQDMAGNDAKEVYLRQLAATIDRGDCFVQMQALKTPILFLVSREDKIVPYETIEKSANNIAGARIETVENCGHFIPLEEPDWCLDKIQNFLS